MIIRRYTRLLLTSIGVLGLGLTLGSCSDFSGYVADHWPRWAGGMPNDVPPRPGAPGYDQFVSHGLPDQMPAKPPAATAETQTAAPSSGRPDQKSAAAAAAAGGPIFQQVTAPPATSPAEPGDDANVVNGGLY